MNDKLLGMVYYCGTREYRHPSRYDNLYHDIKYISLLIQYEKLTQVELDDCFRWMFQAKMLLTNENIKNEFTFECVEARLP